MEPELDLDQVVEDQWNRIVNAMLEALHKGYPEIFKDID